MFIGQAQCMKSLTCSTSSTSTSPKQFLVSEMQKDYEQGQTKDNISFKN